MTTIPKLDGDGRIQITPSELEKCVDTSKWFISSVKVPALAQTLLENYSSLAPGEVAPHVTDLRARAFQAWPYPCIGQLRFLDLIASKHPAYASIISRLKDGETFLDAGCCLGQDLRKLLHDGAPSSQALYGIDIEPAFFDLGYELFRDREKIHATFIAADLTHSSFPMAIAPLRESIDIISAQSLFHLFNLEDQKTLARHLVKLTKPRAGSMIVGRHVGTREAREVRGIAEGTTVFTHDIASFEEFWKDVGAATGSSWDVDLRFEKAPEPVSTQEWSPPDIIFLVFTVVRL